MHFVNAKKHMVKGDALDPSLSSHFSSTMCYRRSPHSRFTAVRSLSVPPVLGGRWALPKPTKGFRPLGFIVAGNTNVFPARETSRLRVVCRCAALPTGQTLPFGALNPDKGYALDPSLG